MSSPDQLSALITAGWAAQAVYAMAELRIADLLESGPMTAQEVAANLDLDALAAERLLNALATLELVGQTETGQYELTPLGTMLREDAPNSMRAWAIWWGHYNWPVWGNLVYSIRTGKSARAMLSGTEAFGMIEADPMAAAVFDRAMSELTRLSSQSVTNAYDFSPFSQIMDVGGGKGELLAAVLAANPNAKGILFERKHALEAAERRLADDPAQARIEFVEGDFFASIPSGSDAIVLKSVIHDWNDEDAGRILANCRRALESSATLILVERVLPDRFGTTPADRAAARADLHMLVALGAKERSESAFRKLLKESGFDLRLNLPAEMGLNVLEAVPV